MKKLLKKITAMSLAVATVSTSYSGLMAVSAKSYEDAFNPGNVLLDEKFNGTTLTNVGVTETLTYIEETSEEISKDPKNSQNQVLHITRPAVATGTNTFVSIPFADEAVSSGIVEVELDLYAATNGVGVGVTDDCTWPGGVMSIITDNITPYNAASGKKCTSCSVSKTDWTHIKYQIDVEKQTYNMWVGDHQCATGFNFRQPNTSDTFDPVKYITFWLLNVTNNVEMYVDNVKVTHIGNALANDDFNRSTNVLNSFWSSIISNNTNGISLVNRVENNSSDKAVYVDLTNKSSFDGIQRTFDSTDNTLLFNVDYKIPSSTGRNLSINFKGKDFDNTGRESASFTVSYNNIKYTEQTVGGTATGVVLKSGINRTDWQNLKLVLYTKDNSVGVFHNNQYLGVVPFRFEHRNATLHNVRIGGAAAAASVTDGVYFDNVTLIDTGATKPAVISDTIYSWDFNGSATKLPDRFSGKGQLVPKDSSSTTERVLNIDGSAAATAKANFSLPNAITSGKVDFTYKFKTNNTTAANQFYLYSDSTIVLHTSITKNALTAVYADTNHKTKVSGVDSDVWHTITYHIDVDNKTYAYTLDDNPKTRYYPLRNFDSMTGGITNGYFGISNATSATNCQIDDFRISEDVTNYGKMELNCNSPISVNSEAKTISGVGNNDTVADVLGKLSTTTPYVNFYITDSYGDKKEGTEKVESKDFVFVDQSDYHTGAVYTILPQYQLEIRGVTVNGNEYFECDSIPVFGKVKARTVVTNNLPSEKVFDVCVAIIGSKLYDVQYKGKVTVDPVSTARLEFDLEIPELKEDAKIKVMLLEGDGSLTPLTECEYKLINSDPEISMPNIFSDHMVLQRNLPVNIFGIAPSGSEINVTFGDYTAEGVAANNEFLVQLPEMDGSNVGKDLVVKVTNDNGEKVFTYTDVVVGEVIYGGGQSNMQLNVDWYATSADSMGAITDVAFVENVRFFETAALTSVANRVAGQEKWIVADSNNYDEISATLHATAMALRNLQGIEANVPIGLLECAVGGTGIAGWASADVILKTDKYSIWHDTYWNRALDGHRGRDTDYYYSMVKAVTPYTCKAAVWYQGEHDVEINFYDSFTADLIEQMREDFGYDIPYIVVQLPGYANGKKWDNFRLVQWNIQNLADKTYIAVTNDTGKTNNIHPNDKVSVGDRIARQIIYNVYGIEIPYTGPVFDSASANGSSVIVECKYVNDGIHGALSLQNGNRCEGFDLSADGTTWHKATSVSVEGNEITVSSTNVSSPKYIRYGYVDTPLKNAGTVSGTDNTFLPLAPFSEAIND